MRKLLHTLLSIFTIALMLSSCSSSNDVVSSNGIQKRKYRSGFHMAGKKKATKIASVKESTETPGTREIAAQDNGEASSDTTETYAETSYAEVGSTESTKWWHRAASDGQSSDEADEVAPNSQGQALESKDIPRVLQRKIKRLQRQQSVAGETLLERAVAPIEPSDDPERDAIVSLALAGAWVLLLWFIPFVNIAAGIVGIVFGIKANRGGEDGLGTLGVILNAIELVLSLLWTLYIVFVIALFFAL